MRNFERLYIHTPERDPEEMPNTFSRDLRPKHRVVVFL